MLFKNLKLNSIHINIVFISAFLVAILTKDFRYSNYRWIYQIGGLSCYLFHLLSLVFSTVNSILIVKENLKIKEKTILLLLSLIPVFFWIYSLISISLRTES